MVVSEDLKRELNLKTALFDSCVLSTIKKHIKNPDVQDFLNILGKSNCAPSVHDLLKLEYLRDVNRQSELNERKEFIEKLCIEFSLPVPPQIYKDAAILSYIYIRHQNKGVDLVDLISSAVLKNYASSLVLVTENHKDFPLSIHDRIGSAVLDLGKELSTLGFYRINEEKWNQEVKELVASGEWNN